MFNGILSNLNEWQLHAIAATEGRIRVVCMCSNPHEIIARHCAFLIEIAHIAPINILCCSIEASEIKTCFKKYCHHISNLSFIQKIENIEVSSVNRYRYIIIDETSMNNDNDYSKDYWEKINHILQNCRKTYSVTNVEGIEERIFSFKILEDIKILHYDEDLIFDSPKSLEEQYNQIVELEQNIASYQQYAKETLMGILTTLSKRKETYQKDELIDLLKGKYRVKEKKSKASIKEKDFKLSKKSTKKRILIIGFGGSGIAVLNKLCKEVKDVELIVCDKDEKSLQLSEVKNKIPFPSIQYDSFYKPKFQKIANEGYDIIYLVCGLGGTGAFLAFEFSKIVKEEHGKTKIFVTAILPQIYKDSTHKKRAEFILQNIKCDSKEIVSLPLTQDINKWQKEYDKIIEQLSMQLYSSVLVINNAKKSH